MQAPEDGSAVCGKAAIRAITGANYRDTSVGKFNCSRESAFSAEMNRTPVADRREVYKRDAIPLKIRISLSASDSVEALQGMLHIFEI